MGHTNLSSSLNRFIAKTICNVIGQSGEMFTCGSGRRDFSQLEFFTSMFPMKHVKVIKNVTNIKLAGHNIRLVTSGEKLKFFGVLDLLKRLTVPNRRVL